MEAEWKADGEVVVVNRFLEDLDPNPVIQTATHELDKKKDNGEIHCWTNVGSEALSERIQRFARDILQITDADVAVSPRCPVPVGSASGDVPVHRDVHVLSNKQEVRGWVAVIYLSSGGWLHLDIDKSHEHVRIDVKPGMLIAWRNDKCTHSFEATGTERWLAGPIAFLSSPDSLRFEKVGLLGVTGAPLGILGSTPNPEDEKESRECGERCGLKCHSACRIAVILTIIVLVAVLIVYYATLK